MIIMRIKCIKKCIVLDTGPLRVGAPQVQRVVVFMVIIITLGWPSIQRDPPGRLRASKWPSSKFRGMRTFRQWHSCCPFLWPGQGSSRAGRWPRCKGEVGVSSVGEVGSWHLHTWKQGARLPRPIWGHCIKGFHFTAAIFRCPGPPPALTTSHEALGCSLAALQ